MSRRDVVLSLAPPAPPCWESRDSWREYVVAVSEAQSEKGQPAAIIFVNGKPRFNMELDFCADCTPLYAVARRSQGRCKPYALADRKPPLMVLQLMRDFLSPDERKLGFFKPANGTT